MADSTSPTTGAAADAGLAGIGLGPLGIILGVLQAGQQANAANAQQMTNAATARWAPFTGLRPGANDWGTGAVPIAQGALAGAQAQSQQNLNNAYMNFLNNTSTPGSALGPPLSERAMANLPPSQFGMSPWQQGKGLTPLPGAAGSGSGAAAYSNAGPYSGLQSAQGGSARAMSSPYNLAPSQQNGPGYMNGSLAQFPYSDAVPQGYRGPTRNRDGTLGPYAGNPGTANYDAYDQPRLGS